MVHLQVIRKTFLKLKVTANTRNSPAFSSRNIKTDMDYRLQKFENLHPTQIAETCYYVELIQGQNQNL